MSEKHLLGVVVVDGQPSLEKFDLSEKTTYEVVSEIVGGYLEAIQISESVTLWFNEEGKVKDLAPNFFLTDSEGNRLDYIAGNAIFTGSNYEGETISIRDVDYEEIIKRFTGRSFRIR